MDRNVPYPQVQSIASRTLRCGLHQLHYNYSGFEYECQENFGDFEKIFEIYLSDENRTRHTLSDLPPQGGL